jgi:hypothetical protein
MGIERLGSLKRLGSLQWVVIDPSHKWRGLSLTPSPTQEAQS